MYYVFKHINVDCHNFKSNLTRQHYYYDYYYYPLHINKKNISPEISGRGLNPKSPPLDMELPNF